MGKQYHPFQSDSGPLFLAHTFTKRWEAVEHVLLSPRAPSRCVSVQSSVVCLLSSSLTLRCLLRTPPLPVTMAFDLSKGLRDIVQLRDKQVITHQHVPLVPIIHSYTINPANSAGKFVCARMWLCVAGCMKQRLFNNINFAADFLPPDDSNSFSLGLPSSSSSLPSLYKEAFIASSEELRSAHESLERVRAIIKRRRDNGTGKFKEGAGGAMAMSTGGALGGTSAATGDAVPLQQTISKSKKSKIANSERGSAVLRWMGWRILTWLSFSVVTSHSFWLWMTVRVNV